MSEQIIDDDYEVNQPNVVVDGPLSSFIAFIASSSVWKTGLIQRRRDAGEETNYFRDRIPVTTTLT